MRILKSEICKLFSRRTVWILWFLLAVNPLLQLYSAKTRNEDGYTLSDYGSLYREVSPERPENILTGLKEREENAKTYGEFNLSRRVYREIEAILSYSDYLASIDDKADEIAIMQRFADDGGYALKNAAKTSAVYDKLKGTAPKVQDPMPLLAVTDNAVTDYLAIIIIFILSLNLVFYEKNEDQLGLLRTTKEGRSRLMAAKAGAMFLSVLTAVIGLYAVNAVIGRCLYGAIDFGSPLQSIYLYRQSPFGITIGQYLGLWFLAKVLTCFLVGIFFMLMGALFNSIIFVFVTSAAAILLETVLYAKIPATHFLSIFKYVNISYGIRTGDMFADYVNLNLFETPVNTCLLYWIVWLLVTAVVAWSVIRYLEVPHETKASSAGKRIFLKKPESHTSVFLHECYKMLVPGRCLIVLILAVLFTIRWNPAEKVQFDSMDEVYYKDYMDRFEGPLDAETRALLQAEQDRFDSLFENIQADLSQGKSQYYIDTKYRDEMKRQSAFDKVSEHVSYVETVPEGQLFFDKGYSILTDGNNYKNRDIMQAFMFVILLIAVAFGIYGVDYRNSETRILRTTCYGRGKLTGIKCILGVCGTLIAFLLSYIVFAVNILKAYGTGGLGAPAASMEHLSKIPQSISVGGYLLLVMLMRFADGLLVVVIISLGFRYFKNSIPVVIACVVVFLIPLVLVAFGIPNTQYLLLNPLLLGNVF